MPNEPVLYVEDDQNDAYFMLRAFEKCGLPNPLVVVGNAHQATDYLAGNGDYADRQKFPFPCLVLLDLKLAGPSGFEVLKWMRGRGLDLPKVVVLSSSGQALDIELAKKLGVVDYIIKPGSPSKLTEIVVRIQEYWR